MDKESKKEQRKSEERQESEKHNQWHGDSLDDINEQSFPASDPPSFTPGSHTGCPPKKKPDPPDQQDHSH